MVRSFSTVFSVGRSFPIVSVGNLPDIVLRRGMISILLYCSVALTFVSLQLSLRLVLFCFRRYRVPANKCVFGKNSYFLLLARCPAFSSLDNTSNNSSHVLVYFRVLLLLCHLTMPVCCIPVFGQFFLERLWECRQVRRTLFKSVVSVKFCSGNCKYALSTCFFG